MGEGHAVRVTTRAESGRAAIEAVGAECWIGTPERLGTLRAALESVTIVCWLLGTASGSEEELGALHGSRWPVGMVAGSLYALALLRRGRIGDAIAAHATTNALIAVDVLAFHHWNLW